MAFILKPVVSALSYVGLMGSTSVIDDTISLADGDNTKEEQCNNTKKNAQPQFNRKTKDIATLTSEAKERLSLCSDSNSVSSSTSSTASNGPARRRSLRIGQAAISKRRQPVHVDSIHGIGPTVRAKFVDARINSLRALRLQHGELSKVKFRNLLMKQVGLKPHQINTITEYLKEKAK